MKHIVLLLLVGILAAAGCGCDSKCGYTIEQWNVKDKQADYLKFPTSVTYEYPGCFREFYLGYSDVLTARLKSYERSTTGDAISREAVSTGRSSDLGVCVYVFDENLNPRINPCDNITLAECMSQGISQMYDKEIFREKISVDGRPAIKTKHTDIKDWCDEEYQGRIIIHTVLEYSNGTILISADCWEEEVEEVEEYYDHLLETFQIVE